MSEPVETSQPPAGPAPGPPAQLSRPALLSFLLGLFSLPLLIVTGLPALVLGYRGLYAINASEGRLCGRWLAVSGMVLGSLGSLVGVGYLVLVLFGLLNQTSARADCTNNLRQLGQAVLLYHDNHQKTYPQAVVAGALPPEKRLSWLASILPYLNRKTMPKDSWQTLVESLDPEQSWEAPANKLARSTRVTTFLCRGHPGPGPAQPPEALTHYVGLAGIGDRAADLSANDPAAGFFGYDRPLTSKHLGIDPADRNRPPQQGGTGDRSSYILIAAETTLDNGPWVAGGRPTVRGLDLGNLPLFGRDAQFGGCHPGGCNTLWLDGSVRFEADSLPPDLFAEMVRINKTGEARPTKEP